MELIIAVSYYGLPAVLILLTDNVPNPTRILWAAYSFAPIVLGGFLGLFAGEDYWLVAADESSLGAICMLIYVIFGNWIVWARFRKKFPQQKLPTAP